MNIIENRYKIGEKVSLNLQVNTGEMVKYHTQLFGERMGHKQHLVSFKGKIVNIRYLLGENHDLEYIYEINFPALNKKIEVKQEDEDYLNEELNAEEEKPKSIS